ncbi:MAG TPA: LapA family protein [Gammaproteobacteria bacterium]|nr:LapA family protein [Gammaproteobacteria bacterium]
MNEPGYRADTPSTVRRTPVKQQIKRGLWVFALVLVLIFILQNIQTVALTYWFWGFQWPLALLIIITLAVGMLLGWALTRLVQARRRS